MRDSRKGDEELHEQTESMKWKHQHAAALAALEQPTQAAEDLSFLYRKTSVAQALAEGLQEFSETQDLPENVVADTMEAFDKAILTAMETVRNVAGRAKGEAELDAYNNINERWRFVFQDGASLATVSDMSLYAEQDGEVAGCIIGPCSVSAVDVAKVVKGGNVRHGPGRAKG